MVEQIERELAESRVGPSPSGVVSASTAEAALAEIRQLQRLLDDERMWDALDLARFAGTSRNWVYLRAEAGHLPSVRQGGLVRFNPRVIKPLLRGERAPEGGRVIALPRKSSQE